MEPDINPKGLVPAVEYKGKALYESLVICEFLEEEYPEHKPHILPPDAFSRALARIWVDHISKAFIPAFFRLLQAQSTEGQDQARDDVYDALRKLAKEIKGPYFLGEEFGLVDIAIAPWIVRDNIIQEHRGYERAAVSEEWKKYADHVEKRDSVVKTQSVGCNACNIRGVLLTSLVFSSSKSIIRRYTVAICATRPRVRLLKLRGRAL